MSACSGHAINPAAVPAPRDRASARGGAACPPNGGLSDARLTRHRGPALSVDGHTCAPRHTRWRPAEERVSRSTPRSRPPLGSSRPPRRTRRFNDASAFAASTGACLFTNVELYRSAQPPRLERPSGHAWKTPTAADPGTGLEQADHRLAATGRHLVGRSLSARRGSRQAPRATGRATPSRRRHDASSAGARGPQSP